MAIVGRVTQRVVAADRVIDHVTDYMVAAAGASAKTKPMFSVDGGHTGPYTRNADTWLPGVDWSSMPVRLDYGGGNISPLYRGCLVTPIHLLAVNHAGLQTGNTVYFLGSDDQMYSRTVSSIDGSLAGNDIRVALLSSALPSAVAPAKLLPSSIDTWIDNTDHDDLAEGGFPVVILDQELKVTAHRWDGYISSQANVPFDDVSPMSTYAELLVNGDSASPCYMIINDEPILLCIISAIEKGTALHLIRSGLDAAITSLGGGYSLEAVDLSGFAT